MIIPVLRDFFFPSEYSLLFSQMPPELPEKEKHRFEPELKKQDGFCSLRRGNLIIEHTIIHYSPLE